MKLRALRDNFFINAIGRVLVRGLVKFSKRTKKIANKYRIFGTVRVNVENVKFKIYSEGDDFIANDIYYGLDYEKEEFKLIKELVRRGKYFVDVGANTGIFSVFASRVNPRLIVLSFEPHPGNYKRIVKNAALNQTFELHIFPLAVGNKASTISFTVPSNESLSTISSANDGFTRNFSPISFKKIDVKQTTLDLFLGSYQLTSADLIKIDVEYYELEVLEGCVTLLSAIKPWVLLEVLNYNNLVDQFPHMKGKIREDHADKIERLLSSCGYYAYQLQEEGVQFLQTVVGHRSSRNFLFSPVYLPNQFIPYHELADTFSSLH